MSKNLSEANVEHQIWKGLESDISYLMERVSRLEAARPPPARDSLLNPDSAATLIGVKPATLAMWRHKGKGPSYIKVGRSAYYRPGDIETWMDAQCIVPKAE